MSGLARGLEKKFKYAFWEGIGLLFSPRQETVDFKEVRSVLVVRPDRLGDVVLSTPVYESIKRSFPWVRLTALVDRANAGILSGNPFIDHILEFDRKRPWAILPELRSNRFDVALTLNKMFSATASLFTLFSGARYRVGYETRQNAWVHNIRVVSNNEPRHETQNNLELLRALGASRISDPPRIYFNDEETRKVRALLKEKRKFPDRPAILIKPGTRVPEWGWRLEKFQETAERLMESGRGEVFFICGPGEESMIDSLIDGMKHPAQRLPVLPVKELALLIQQCALLFCNHTGIMHLASAVTTPLLVIFKHGEIKRWGPCHTPHVILEERNAETLSVENVLEAIAQLLNKEKTHTDRPD